MEHGAPSDAVTQTVEEFAPRMLLLRPSLIRPRRTARRLRPFFITDLGRMKLRSGSSLVCGSIKSRFVDAVFRNGVTANHKISQDQDIHIRAQKTINRFLGPTYDWFILIE